MIGFKPIPPLLRTCAVSTSRFYALHLYVAKITSSANITKYPALNIANLCHNQTHSPMKWRSVRLCYI